MRSDPLPIHPGDLLLQELLDGELPPAVQEQLQAHFAACPACAARLEGLRAFFTAIDDLPDAPLTRDLSPAVLARLSPPQRVENLPRASRLVFGLQLAAGLALLLFFWPAAWSQVQRFALPVRMEDVFVQASLFFETGWLHLQALLAQLAGQAAVLARPPALPTLGGLTGILIVSAAAVVWLAGNGYLIWNQTHLRRRK